MARSELGPAERHRWIAGDFTTVVQKVTDWGASAPVAGWTARDVVDHLVTWLPSFLAAGGVELSGAASPAAGSDVDDPDADDPDVEDPDADGPVGAWSRHAAAVQALLDDPDRAAALYSYERVGRLPAAEAIDRFYTSDVFMHTWDLARASNQEVTLDADLCEQLLAGMEPMEEMIRASGQYGPRVQVPEDADAQTRLIGFIGRDPFWRSHA